MTLAVYFEFKFPSIPPMDVITRTPRSAIMRFGLSLSHYRKWQLVIASQSEWSPVQGPRQSLSPLVREPSSGSKQDNRPRIFVWPLVQENHRIVQLLIRGTKHHRLLQGQFSPDSVSQRQCERRFSSFNLGIRFNEINWSTWFILTTCMHFSCS